MGKKIFLNIDRITGFKKKDEGDGTTIWLSDKTTYDVKESVDEVWRMIFNE